MGQTDRSLPAPTAKRISDRIRNFRGIADCTMEKVQRVFAGEVLDDRFMEVAIRRELEAIGSDGQTSSFSGRGVAGYARGRTGTSDDRIGGSSDRGPIRVVGCRVSCGLVGERSNHRYAVAAVASLAGRGRVLDGP